MSSKVSIAGVDTTKLPKLTNDDLLELMRKVKAGDSRARDYFVVANLRLVLLFLIIYFYFLFQFFTILILSFIIFICFYLFYAKYTTKSANLPIPHHHLLIMLNTKLN